MTLSRFSFSAAVVFLSWAPALASAQPRPAYVASTWEVELAAIEREVAALSQQGRAEEALDVLASTPAENLIEDRAALRRLLRAAESIEAPGSEPEWLYAGGALMLAGGVGALATGLVYAGETLCFGFGHTCVRDEPPLAPFVVALAFASGAFVTGLVHLVVGLINHTFDPERREFLARRRELMRAFVDASRGVGFAW